MDGNSGPFAVTAPNTAVTWTGGSNQTVTWSVNNTNAAPLNCANVKISLSTDGGNTFPMILAASTANDSSESISVPSSTLVIGASGSISRSSGYIIGSLKKLFSSTGSFTYTVGTANGYSPMTVAVTAGTGELTIKANQGAHSALNSSSALQRYWTLNGSGVTVNLGFNYLQTDVSGNESIYRIHKINGSTVTNYINACPSPCVDATANTATINGINSFSDWTMAEPNGVTAVEFASFVANQYDKGTLIEWQTGFEAENLGFNVYRDEAGKRSLVNAQMVAGSALTTGLQTVLQAGESYALWDNSTNTSVAYWLEDIDLKGQASWHGPFYAKMVGGNPPAKSLAATLAGLNGNANQMTTTPALEKVAAQSIASAQQTATQARFVAQQAVKISVKGEGLYRITQPELVAAGLAANVDAKLLQLFVEGKELPIKVSTNKDGRFDESSSLEFYGIGIDTPSSATRAYWLLAGTQTGQRVQLEGGEGVSSSEQSFAHTVERKDRTIYFSSLRNGDSENFFGAVLTSAPLEQLMTLPNVDAQTSQPATVEIALQGVTQIAHRVQVQLNGTIIGELNYNGQQRKSERFTVPHSLLRDGANTIRLLTQNGAADVSLVDFLRIQYQHLFIADNDALIFTAASGERTIIDGFTSKAIRVFDVTDERALTELIGDIEETRAGYAVTVAANAKGERRLFALTDEGWQAAASVTANLPSSWRSAANAADFVIITRRDFFAPLAQLQQIREAQGLETVIVDVEDLYDEFSFSQKSPQAIKDFLNYAATNWRTKPRFVLLAADATYDGKNYLKLGDYDLLPTKLIDTTYMETASDEWLADFNNDSICELAIGRLPVRTSQEAAVLVKKLVGYDKAVPSEEVTLIADRNDGYNFEQATTNLRSLTPSGITVAQIFRSTTDDAMARGAILQALNRGQKVVNYSGHGSVNLWRGNLLKNDDAAGLSNSERLSLFVMMTCLNGYFQDAALDSLGESLLKAEQGGAVAAWASSSLCLPHEQSLMNQELYRVLFDANAKSMTLGEAIHRAKAAITDADIRRSWILLGDPTMRLR